MLSNTIALLTEELWVAFDYASRTYDYLQSAREYERVVRQKMSKPARSATQQARPGFPGT